MAKVMLFENQQQSAMTLELKHNAAVQQLYGGNEKKIPDVKGI
jgi:hypothetical protein